MKKDRDLLLENTSKIGQKVLRVGRTIGLRHGRVVAFGYEYHDQEETRYTDLLIIGTDRDEIGRLMAFSTGGDSGSLIVTDDKSHSPIGLLWGGADAERLRPGHAPENWTYASSLTRVLDDLEIDLLSGTRTA
ncbi:MAG TPA: hypothetical protein VIV14_01310 [Gammaproteobacteria bacterium]